MLQTSAAQEKVKANRVSGVRTVLVVLSSIGMAIDIASLRHEITLAYPGATVFFQTTDGKSVGAANPSAVDLLIDFSGPGSRDGFFRIGKLARMAKTSVGRNSGSRAKKYSKVFDEKGTSVPLPGETMARERVIQREVLALAGVLFAQQGTPGPDRGKSIALELPPFQKL